MKADHQLTCIITLALLSPLPEGNISSHSCLVKSGLRQCCVSYAWPTALIYFLGLTPEDIGCCDLWLQVWGEGESHEVALPFPCHLTDPCSPLSHQLLEEEPCSSAHEHKAADGGKRALFALG